MGRREGEPIDLGWDFSGVPLKRSPFPLLECWVGRTRRIKQRGREEVDPSKFVDPNPCHSTMEYHNVAGRGRDRGSGGGVTTVFLFMRLIKKYRWHA